jgi:phosphatidylethanolamine-binding protein (PEBP) family uncharacterized protein
MAWRWANAPLYLGAHGTDAKNTLFDCAAGESMSGAAPDWLVKAIGNAAASANGAGGLAAARLASEKTLGRGGFTLSSPAFGNGEELDPCFTACEEDSVAPPFEWTAPPPGAQELVLIAQELSAEGEAQLHWLVWGLAPQKGKLLEGEVPPRVGKNAKGNSEWLLPDPPLGVTHQYVFQLFALDLPLVLMPGATYDELLGSIENTVTACTILTAQFEGHEVEEWDIDDEE